MILLLLLLLVILVANISVHSYLLHKVKNRISIFHSLKNDNVDSKINTDKLRTDSYGPIVFDISLAVILAGYSFEAYNEPVSSHQ